jgi:hypothetical protein
LKTKRARHKTGRDKFSITFSIPKSQIDWFELHPEINQSHLVSSLLAIHIEASDGVQPDKVKLILRLRALETELEKAGKELELSHHEFTWVKGKYDDALANLKILRHLTQLPTEELKITFEEQGNYRIVWVSDKNSKNKCECISFPYNGQNEPMQIHAILAKKLEEAEGSENQSKIAKLKQNIELPESIYKTFKQNHENISKQIGELERLIIKQE